MSHDSPAEIVDRDVRLSAIQQQLTGMPQANMHAAHVLFKHLKKVAERAADNKMTPSNLGVVFGPTLMRSEHPQLVNLQAPNFIGVCWRACAAGSSWAAVECMLADFDAVFAPVTQLLHQGGVRARAKVHCLTPMQSLFDDDAAMRFSQSAHDLVSLADAAVLLEATVVVPITDDDAPAARTDSVVKFAEDLLCHGEAGTLPSSRSMSSPVHARRHPLAQSAHHRSGSGDASTFAPVPAVGPAPVGSPRGRKKGMSLSVRRSFSPSGVKRPETPLHIADSGTLEHLPVLLTDDLAAIIAQYPDGHVVQTIRDSQNIELAEEFEFAAGEVFANGLCVLAGRAEPMQRRWTSGTGSTTRRSMWQPRRRGSCPWTRCACCCGAPRPAPCDRSPVGTLCVGGQNGGFFARQPSMSRQALVAMVSALQADITCGSAAASRP